MSKFKVFISGQKYFAEQVFILCQKLDMEIVGVCCPLDDKYIGRAAKLWGVPIIPAECFRQIICQSVIQALRRIHLTTQERKQDTFHVLVGLVTTVITSPTQELRSSIEWAIRMKEPITGGTVFWLNAGIDRGDIAYQDWCWIPPEYFGASKIGFKVMER